MRCISYLLFAFLQLDHPITVCVLFTKSKLKSRAEMNQFFCVSEKLPKTRPGASCCAPEDYPLENLPKSYV